MDKELLLQGASGFGLRLTEKELVQFETYLQELQRWNRSINLTAIKSTQEITIKHFIDSLSLVPLLNSGDHLLDVGSGAGLPGLAVAIVRQDVTITSIDAVSKKISFQTHICRTLGLKNVITVHQRIEQHLQDQPESYSVVTSRAFRDLPRFLQLAGGLVQPGGRLVAMLSDHEKNSEDSLVTDPQFFLQESINYMLPAAMGKRKLVVLAKLL